MVHGMHSVVDALAKWAEDIDVSEVFVIEGMTIRRVSNTDINSQQILNSERNPIILSSKERKIIHSNNRKENLNIHSLIEGSTTFIGGIVGGLLSSCLSHNISCSVIYISTHTGIPDPDGAAITIELLENTIDNNNFKIDTTELRKEGQFIKEQLSNLIRSIKLQQDQSQLPLEVKQDAVMY
jgi:uncharacterized protein